MTKQTLFTILMCCMQSIYSQNLSWVKQIGGTSRDEANSITTDKFGNIYTTGLFYGTADFDPESTVYNLTSEGSSDIFISKLDASGNFIWAKQFKGSGFNESYYIIVDDDGNVYTTGSFDGPTDFDPGAGIYNLTSYYGIFISKLDSNGKFIWAKEIETARTYYPSGESLCLDANGNLYITGNFSFQNDFDPGPDTFYMSSVGTIDNFILKLDKDGEFLWAKQFGASNPPFYSNSTDIKTDNNMNVYTTGYFSKTPDFDPSINEYKLASKGNHDIFILKLDSSGNFQWVKQFGGSGDDRGNSISIDNLGNIYSTGYFESIADFNPGVDSLHLESNGYRDIYILKLNELGDLVWVKQIGGTDDDAGYSIKNDKNGDIYISGAFEATADFNPDGVKKHNLTSFGSEDIFITKFNSSGNFIWAKQYGGTSMDYGLDITIDMNNNLFFTGHFYKTVNFDTSNSTKIYTSKGSNDICIGKIKEESSSITINEKNNTTFHIFPNPTLGVFSIRNIYLSEDYTLLITDLFGKVIYRRENINDQEFVVDLSESPGIYFVTLNSKKSNNVIKVLIQ